MAVQTVLGSFTQDLNKLRLEEFPCGSGKWRQDADSGYVEKGSVSQETIFSLEELAHSQVFTVKSDWSDDISSLRQLAVRDPKCVSQSFIFQHFTSLRLINRNINEVDRGLLKFTNLKELSLTGNCLTAVPGYNLPRSLTVLQLFANRLCDLAELTIDPPPNLQHIGLGYNQLSDISPYISPTYWPNLLSLDLSHNKICDLKPTLLSLSSLPSLRNLSLLGNPITLVPGYRGCTLDLLPHLAVLDDLSISDDDRIQYAGMSSEEGVIWNQTLLTFNFASLRNLRQPPPNEPIDEGSFNYPVQKKHSYLIRFNFVSDDNPTQPDKPAPMTPPESPRSPPPSPIAREPSETPTPLPHGSLFESEPREWDTHVQFTHPVVVRCSVLEVLPDFLSRDLQFSVVEQVVESFTAVAPPEEATPTPAASAGKKKGGKDEKKKKKDDVGSRDKILKDKDGNILKWVDSSPTFTEIATLHTNIQSLLTDTTVEGSGECDLTAAGRLGSPGPDDGRSSSCSNKGGKAKKGPAAGGKGKKATTPAPTEPPPPVTLDFRVDRVVWGSVQDCATWK